MDSTTSSIQDWTLILPGLGMIHVYEKPGGKLVATWHGPGQMDFYEKELSGLSG